MDLEAGTNGSTSTGTGAGAGAGAGIRHSLSTVSTVSTASSTERRGALLHAKGVNQEKAMRAADSIARLTSKHSIQGEDITLREVDEDQEEEEDAAPAAPTEEVLNTCKSCSSWRQGCGAYNTCACVCVSHTPRLLLPPAPPAQPRCFATRRSSAASARMCLSWVATSLLPTTLPMSTRTPSDSLLKDTNGVCVAVCCSVLLFDESDPGGLSCVGSTELATFRARQRTPLTFGSPLTSSLALQVRLTVPLPPPRGVFLPPHRVLRPLCCPFAGTVPLQLQLAHILHRTSDWNNYTTMRMVWLARTPLAGLAVFTDTC